MGDFVNTIDLLGDDAVTDSIIDRTIEEFNDDRITSLPGNAFAGCSELKVLRLPNLTGDLPNSFSGCDSLTEVDFPKITSASGTYVFNMGKVANLRLPALASANGWGCLGGGGKVLIDLPVCTSIGGYAFYAAYSLKYLLLRSATKCTFATDALCWYVGSSQNTLVKIFVPSALLEEYKADAVLETYVDRILPIEDFTVDGTKDGEFGYYTVTNNLTNVTTSNADTFTGPRPYYARLTVDEDYYISSATITMNGVDVTAEVYNAETGEISIALITGDLIITAARRRIVDGSWTPDGDTIYVVGALFENEGSPGTLELYDGTTLSLLNFDYTSVSGADGDGNIAVSKGSETLYAGADIVANVINMADGFTFAFKVSGIDTTKTNRYLCYLGTDAGQLAVIYNYVAKKFELYSDFDAAIRNGSQITVSDTGEHTIVYTHDTTTVRCYLDGELINSYTNNYAFSTRTFKELYILNNVNKNSAVIGKTRYFLIDNHPYDEVEITNMLASWEE